MKKIIITIMAVVTVISLASCHSEPVKPELSPEGVETIEVEEIEVETIEVEEIEVEEVEVEEIEVGKVSEEYLKELEFNSQKNKW